MPTRAADHRSIRVPKPCGRGSGSYELSKSGEAVPQPLPNCVKRYRRGAEQAAVSRTDPRPAHR
jgi:hypothetical protein